MKRLLIVDDDPDILISLAVLFETFYELCLARDGAEALQLLDDGFAADAILLDLTMPMLGGAATIRELERRGSRIPIILASAHTELQGFARDLEVADYVMKPYRFEVLQLKLTRLLARTSGGLDGGSVPGPRNVPGQARRGGGAASGRTAAPQPREPGGKRFPSEHELDG